jgi:hypothetical protein
MLRHSPLLLPLYSEQYLYCSTHEFPIMVQTLIVGSEGIYNAHISGSVPV